jgi:hypothetical protein
MARATPQTPDPVPTEQEIAQAVALPPGLELNHGLLQGEFARHPGAAATWRWRRGQAYGDLEQQKVAIRRAELKVDRAAARARLRIKEGLVAKGAFLEDKNGRRVNAEDIEALVCVDGEVTNAADLLTQALAERAALEERLEKLKGACSGFEDRRDMLIQMGAQARAEMAGDPSIRERR